MTPHPVAQRLQLVVADEQLARGPDVLLRQDRRGERRVGALELQPANVPAGLFHVLLEVRGREDVDHARGQVELRLERSLADVIEVQDGDVVGDGRSVVSAQLELEVEHVVE